MTNLYDADLLAYIDGVAPSKIVTEIEGTQDYRDRVGELNQLDVAARAILNRSTCPDSQSLGDYFLGYLDPQQDTSIRYHLASCVRCESEVESMKGFISPIRVKFQKTKTYTARMISDGNKQFLNPAFGIRGGKTGLNVFVAENVHIIIDIQPDPENPGKFLMVGLLAGEELVDFESLSIDVDLLHHNSLVDQTKVDDIGNFGFQNLKPGFYKLCLLLPQKEIYLPDISVQP